MKALVTGGAGFIGSHVVKLLLDKGADVRVLDDLSSGVRTNLSGMRGSLDLTIGTITDSKTVRKAMEDREAVFHLAAIASVQQSIRDPEGTGKVNLLGALYVFEEAASAAAKVVFSSSAAIYGDTMALPVTEETSPKPLSPYAEQKLAAERALRGFQSVSLRYFNVYGPRQDPAAEYAAAVPGFIVKALAEQPLTIYGDGRQTRDFIFVEDVARANLAAFESSVNNAEALNIGSGKSVTILDLARRVVRLTGAKSKILYDEPRPGEVRYSSCQVDASRERIRFRPKVSLNEGLRRTIEYWKSEAPL